MPWSFRPDFQIDLTILEITLKILEEDIKQAFIENPSYQELLSYFPMMQNVFK